MIQIATSNEISVYDDGYIEDNQVVSSDSSLVIINDVIYSDFDDNEIEDGISDLKLDLSDLDEDISDDIYEAIEEMTDTTWEFQGIGDFNGDDIEDFLWRDPITGDNGIWLEGRNDDGYAFTLTSVEDTEWEIEGIGDLDGNGIDDILWYNSDTNQIGVWREGRTDNGYAFVLDLEIPDPEFIEVFDVTGNGIEDIVWYDEVSNSSKVWEINYSNAADIVLDFVDTFV